jgi:hypothetical protein
MSEKNGDTVNPLRKLEINLFVGHVGLLVLLKPLVTDGALPQTEKAKLECQPKTSFLVVEFSLVHATVDTHLKPGDTFNKPVWSLETSMDKKTGANHTP